MLVHLDRQDGGRQKVLKWEILAFCPHLVNIIKNGLQPGNYAKFEKQVYYSQPSKKPPDNADTFQAVDLYSVICHNSSVFRQYSWKSIEGIPPFNDF